MLRQSPLQSALYSRLSQRAFGSPQARSYWHLQRPRFRPERRSIGAASSHPSNRPSNSSRSRTRYSRTRHRGDWLMWRRTLDSWGYSPLDQVNRENVGELRMVWTRNLAARTGEITPLAYGGVLYVPQAEDVIQALDAATGDLIWEYSRDLPEDLYGLVGGNARNNRNIAIYDRADHQHQRRQLRVRARCSDRRNRLGNADLRLPHQLGHAQLGPDHRRRQGHLGA